MLPLHRPLIAVAIWVMMLSLPFPVPAAAQTGLPGPTPEVRALLGQGAVARRSGKTDEALRHFEEAVAKARMLSDQPGEAYAWNEIGILQYDTNKLEEALASHQKALALWKGLPNQDREVGGTHTNIGRVYHRMGRPKEAQEHYEQALVLLRAAQDRNGEGYALNNLAILYRSIGQPREALKLYEETLLIWEELKDHRSMARVWASMGNVYSDMGQLGKALEYLQKALARQREIKDKYGAANTSGSIGGIYSDLGSPSGLRYLQEARRLFREIRDRRSEAMMLNDIGIAYLHQNQPKRALEYFLKALPLLREVKERRLEGGTLTNIGITYDVLGQPKRALEFYQQALPIHRETQDREYEANTLSGMGDSYYALGQFLQAQEQYQSALQLRVEIGDPTGEINDRTYLAMLEERQGHLGAAERGYREAVARVESARASLGGMFEAKMSFLRAYPETYAHYISLLLRRGRSADAFAVVQKTKARALLDLMLNGKVDVSMRITPEEKQQEQALRAETHRLNAAMVQEGVKNDKGAKQRSKTLKEQLARAEGELQKFQESLYARYPDQARKRAAKTATLAEVARFLPEDTALLEYVTLAVGGKEPLDRTALLVVTFAGGRAQVRTYLLPVKHARLTAQADAFRRACADPRKPYRRRAQALYRLLIAPAARQLVGKRRLLICPDKALWDIPFQALHDGRRFLLERYELAYAYSATGVQAALLSREQKQRALPTATLLALANPDFGSKKRFGDNPQIPGQRPIDMPSRAFEMPSRELSFQRDGRIAPLPGTEREAVALRRDFKNATIYTGRSAQETVVKREAGKYRYLHLASHAFFNDAAPLLSSILLANPPPGSQEDGFLTAREIFDLNLSADLVVLSACNTARGEKRNGEGIVGLTWALFVAGAPTQVLSQWAVDDAGTALLMERFYNNLTQNRAGKEQALRTAALSLRKNRRYRHPYFWAPFVLIGDWR